MIRYLRSDFEAVDSTKVDGGATIEERVMVTSSEFEGVGEIGCARMSKGLQMRHGPLRVWTHMAVLAGRVHLESDGEHVTLSAGGIFFIPAGSPHTETVLEDDTVLAYVTGPFDDPTALDNYSISTVKVQT